MVVIFGIIYFQSGAPSTQNKGVMPTTDTTMQAAKSFTVRLAPENNSGQSGDAIISEVDGKTNVTISLSGGNIPTAQPAHFHMGTCATPGEIKYQLNSLVNGKSDEATGPRNFAYSKTILNVSLADFLQSLPLILNVHKSAAEISVYVACGTATPPIPQ